jgi:hypothetical protein
MNAVIYDNTPEEKISIAIQNVLELPSQRREQWISGLRGIEVFLFNKETVQAVDLTDF